MSESIVMHVAWPYLGVGRNITMDNWFTSVSLSDQLEAAHTSMVGTIRSNCRDVPPAAKSTRGRRKKDSQYYIKDNKVMCSFWHKANKPVLLLSTKHSYGNHVQGERPEIVQCYNATKSGVDNLDSANVEDDRTVFSWHL